MAASAYLSSIEEDLSCPICCKTLREPVIFSCSHSFCRPCLEASWRQAGVQDCPVFTLALRSNCNALLRERDRVTEGAMQVKDKGPQAVCSLHSQRPCLFYLEEQCVVCAECVSDHTDHIFCSVAKAATKRPLWMCGIILSNSGNVFGEISHIRRVISDKSTTFIAKDLPKDSPEPLFCKDNLGNYFSIAKFLCL
uniref:RING-type domain-containing protein n=1 Tax=Salmo trutta TaxID=8032 RepID=A0A674E8K9_SALTR